MLQTARNEYISIVARLRLKQSEKAFIPPVPPSTLQFGEKVLVYSDTTARWEPRTFISRNEPTVLVKEPNGKAQPYGISKVSDLREGIHLPRPDIYAISGNQDTQPTHQGRFHFSKQLPPTRLS